ncbi:hypothetical protein INR49_032020 [Caranx melampygus]|nr:hypothetical protein INR49_032020 [Caranx melampygus]
MASCNPAGLTARLSASVVSITLRFLLHFDKVSPALVVEFSIAAVVEERNLQLPLQVTLHLTHLQRPDAIGTIHRQVLLVVCTVGCLPWNQKESCEEVKDDENTEDTRDKSECEDVDYNPGMKGIKKICKAVVKDPKKIYGGKLKLRSAILSEQPKIEAKVIGLSVGEEESKGIRCLNH